MKEKEYTISKESAQEQINTFLDYYEIDPADMEVEQGEETIETILNRLRRGIRRGYLEIREDAGIIQVKQNLKIPIGDVVSIEYGEYGAIHEITMNKVKGDNNTLRMHTFMGSLGNIDSSVFAKMKAVDSSIMKRLATLFMVI